MILIGASVFILDQLGWFFILTSVALGGAAGFGSLMKLCKSIERPLHG